MTMINKNMRNVMSDFEYVFCFTNYVDVFNNDFKIKIPLEVYCKDYIIDISTGNVIRENNKVINYYFYNLTFNKCNNTNLKYCLNCNAKLHDSGRSVKCEYCVSVIIRNADNLILVDTSISET